MITEEQVQGGWTELKGAAKKKWGQLSDDELREFEGSVDEFIGLLQRKTGQARAEVEKWVSQADANVRPFIERTTEAARDYLHSTAEKASEGVDDLRQRVASGQADAEQMVRRHPTESVAVAFGAGVIAGVVVGLLTRSRS